MKITRFKDIPRYTSSGNYTVNVPWGYVKDNLDRYIGADGKRGVAKLDMNPDFQRGHVWTEAQQVAYLEYALSGGMSGRNIYFNCAGWMDDWRGPFVLVDGKQRINAVLSFLDDKVTAFGSHYSEFTDDLLFSEPQFLFAVNNLKTREEVLRWYLQMNAGGTPHTPHELDKVREMLEGGAN